MAIAFGHDVPVDLILIRRDTGILEKVQCKYTESNGRDLATDRCYYVHSSEFDGMAMVSLRTSQPRNGQAKGIRWVKDHEFPSTDSNRPVHPPRLPFAFPPE